MVVLTIDFHPALFVTIIKPVGAADPCHQRDQAADKSGSDAPNSTPCGTFAVSRILAEQPESEKDFDDKARQRQQPGCHQQVS